MQINEHDIWRDEVHVLKSGKILIAKTFISSANIKTQICKLSKTQSQSPGKQHFVFFFYLGFFSRKITNHRPRGEGGGHFFNSSLPLPPTSQKLRH